MKREHGTNKPVTQRGTRHEGSVPDDVHRLGVHTNDDALARQGHTTRILNHSHSVTQREVLVLEAVDRMRRLEDSLARNALDDRLLEASRLLARGKAIRKGFDLLDSVLAQLIAEERDGFEVPHAL